MLHTSLLSAKAPIVAIPRPGDTPLCFDRVKLSSEQRKALKLAALGDTSATVSVQVWHPPTSTKRPHPGVLVDLPELAGLSLALVQMDRAYYVVEIATGKAAGSGKNPQAAMACARANAAKASPRTLTAIYLAVAEAQHAL